MPDTDQREPPEYELVNHCVLPRNLRYDVENDTWARQDGDVVTVGWTDSSQTVTGSILYAHYLKEEGDHVTAGKPIATVEAGKWMGAVQAPFAGTLVELNPDIEEKAEGVHVINKSPYHRGWIAKMEPDDTEEALSGFLPVDEAVEAYERKMTEEDLDDCFHCEAFEI